MSDARDPERHDHEHGHGHEPAHEVEPGHHEHVPGHEELELAFDHEHEGLSTARDPAPHGDAPHFGSPPGAQPLTEILLSPPARPSKPPTPPVVEAPPVELTIDGGASMVVAAGKAPVINGVEEHRMRVGCGSATIGMFAKQWKELVDEVVVVDDHITGVLSEHQAGKLLYIPPTGIKIKGRRSTPGR